MLTPVLRDGAVAYRTYFLYHQALTGGINTEDLKSEDEQSVLRTLPSSTCGAQPPVGASSGSSYQKGWEGS